MIPSPYVEYVKEHWKRARREIVFLRKMRTATDIFDHILESRKALALTLKKDDVQVFKVNMTDKELVEVGKFLIERYGHNTIQ